MSPITFFSSIVWLIISVNNALLLKNKPVILIIQGAIENDGFLPISIFWYHPKFAKNDRLTFYSLYPQKLYLDFIKIESSTGFHELPHKVLEHGGSSDKYCAELILEDGTLFSSSCYPKIQWMYDRKDLLGDVSLMELVIPGTHQSAAYTKSSNESLDDQSLISRWIVCQRKSIKSQLMDGIRYLDLRPGYLYVEGKKKYIVTHSVFDLMTMDEVVRQINEFMALSEDIVIVSFREFKKGFNSHDDHLDFINYLERSFMKNARPRQSWGVELNEIFRSPDKRLILSYEHDAAKTSPIMWLPIVQYWSNSQTINRLYSFFDEIYQGKIASWNNNKFISMGQPYTAMMEFTHSAETVIQDIFTKDLSLRHWAQKLGRYIPQWYIGEWSLVANIIAVDFYQTSGIVDLAIQLNERRFERPRSNHSRMKS